jgi:hypothetical protein
MLTSSEVLLDDNALQKYSCLHLSIAGTFQLCSI